MSDLLRLDAEPSPRVVKFDGPRVEDDNELVATLLDLLRKARSEQILGFAMVVISDDGEGFCAHNAAPLLSPDHKLRLLGAMRRLEQRFHLHNWPEDYKAP